MRKLEEVRSLLEKTRCFADTARVAQFGKVDILVNNAAGKNIFKPTAEITEAEYNSMFDITRGVYFNG